MAFLGRLFEKKAPTERAVEKRGSGPAAPAPSGETTAVAGMDTLESAYLVVDDPALEEKVGTALDEVARSEGGISRLVDRIFKTVTLEGGTVRVVDHGDMTWNDLLKVRMVVQALGRAKAPSAVATLASLLSADSDYAQFHEIVQPAVACALGEIGTEEAISALRGALPRTDLLVATTTAVQEVLARVQPANAAAADAVIDINKRQMTGRVGCIGFALKDPARRDSFAARLAALATTGGGPPAKVDAVFGYLETECTVEHPYVYDQSFLAAWSKVKGDVVFVTDFEDKWPQFEKKMKTQSYSGEPALLRAYAVNGKALELTAQFLSSGGEVIATL